jgi:hypothetical protein
MTLSQKIGIYAAWMYPGHAAPAIIQQVRAYGLRGVARQSTADAAMLHMIQYQEARK